MKHEINLSKLPSFIGDFNGIYAFINNISSIFSPIFNLPKTPGGTINLAHINSWMEETSGDLDSINEELNKLIDSGNLTNEQLTTLVDIEKDQEAIMTSINDELNSISQALGTYLPEILSGISIIEQQCSQIISLLGDVLNELSDIEYKIEKLTATTDVSISITQMSDSFEKLMSFCNTFFVLSDCLKKSTADNNGDVAISCIQLTAFTAFCQSIALGGSQDLSVHLDAINSILMGQGIDGKSLYETYSEYIHHNIQSSSASNSTYILYYKLVILQSQAFSIYATANKFLGYDISSFQTELEKRINSQREVYKTAPYNLAGINGYYQEYDTFTTSVAPKYAMRVTEGFNYDASHGEYPKPDIPEAPEPDYDDHFYGVLLEADEGKVLLSISIDEHGHISGYQGAVHYTQIEGIEKIDSGHSIYANLLKARENAIPGGYYYYSGVCGSGPDRYITAIGVDGRNMFNVTTVEVNSDGYINPLTKETNPMSLIYNQEIDDFGSTDENTSTLNNQAIADRVVYMRTPVELRDKFIAPLVCFGVNIKKENGVRYMNFSVSTAFHDWSYQADAGINCYDMHHSVPYTTLYYWNGQPD